MKRITRAARGAPVLFAAYARGNLGGLGEAPRGGRSGAGLQKPGDGERGGATVLAALTLVALAPLLGAVLAFGSAHAQQAKLQAAADFAAIAAAQATFEPFWAAWEPCAAAQAVASANAATLEKCAADSQGRTARVELSTRVRFGVSWQLRASARAGQS